MPSKARKLLNKLKELEDIKTVYVFIHYDKDDKQAAARAREYLCEGSKTFALGQGKAVRFDRAHVPGSQDHLHFLQNGKNLFALNRDGTAHDKSHGVQMANWAVDYVKTQYPDWTLPKDGLIESVLVTASAMPLFEVNEHRATMILIEPKTLVAAENIASTIDPLLEDE